MFRTILAGYDGGERGRSAVAHAALLAGATGAGLTLVTAHPQQPMPYVTSSDDARRQADAALRAVREELAPGARTLVVGALSPADALCRAAAQRHADLLVVGTSHHGRADRLFDADHALQVLHGAPCAVSVVPDGARIRPRLRRIVVGIDGSPESDRALAVAVDLARAAGASLWLEAVATDPALSWPYAPAVALALPVDADGLPLGARADAEELRERTLAGLEGVDADGGVTGGDPARRLAEATATADVVVVGSRRWGALQRVVVGSTSEGVVRRGRGPVLVVPRGARGSKDGAAAASAYAAGAV